MRSRFTLLILLICNGLLAQQRDTVSAFPDECGSCVKIQIKFFVTGWSRNEPQLTQSVSGNIISITAAWDTIDNGCIPMEHYVDTTLSMCNLAPKTYQVECKSQFYESGMLFGYYSVHKDSSETQFDIHSCFNPFRDESIAFCPDNQESKVLDAGAGYVSYLWLPGGETTQSIVVVDPGKYSVKVTDLKGSIFNDSILVNSVCAETCFIPNSFTPNDDGINDEFKPICNYTSDFKLMIFDRWGNKLFETDNSNEGWNGIPINTNQIAQQDIYCWILNAKDQYGNNFVKRGRLLLLR